MTYHRARGPGPENYHAVDVTEVSSSSQEAALIGELRRLQKFLKEENLREHPQSPRPTGHPRREGKSPAGKSADGTVNRLLDRLGLNRRKSSKRSRAHDRFPASARQMPRQEPKLPLDPRPVQGHERIASLPIAAKTESGHLRQRGPDHSPRLSLVSLTDRIGIPPPPEEKSRVRTAFTAAREILRPVRVIDHVRSAYAFLAGHADAKGLDEGSEARLTTRLFRAFESELKTGLRVLIIGVGILGGWATFVPLSGAVIVPGALVVESEVKKIQHPAGGVVAQIPVRDGMNVRAGDLLLQLDETQLRANAQVLAQQLNQVRVRLARLMAERDGLDQPQMPHEMASRPDDQDLGRLWASEVSLFKSRAAARRSAKQLLHSRVEQLGEQISGLDAQIKAKAAQHQLISGELEGVDSLYQKGLVPLTRKTSLQREAARLDGERGQVAAAIAEAKSKISEAELQDIRTDHDFRTEVMKDLREAQDKEAELIEKTTAAQDLLKRVDLRAPTNGIVHQLSVHTIGGVITPGEVVMEIVPESDELQIEAKLPSQEIDHVHSGQRAYIRFSAFNQRTTPQLDGVVSYVSADLNRDRQKNSNAAPSYTVRVTLPSGERRRLGGLQLVSGMPVEVFLQTGSRTMMSYLLKPITDQLLRTFK
jgi:HlyD family secretion protein